MGNEYQQRQLKFGARYRFLSTRNIVGLLKLKRYAILRSRCSIYIRGWGRWRRLSVLRLFGPAAMRNKAGLRTEQLKNIYGHDIFRHLRAEPFALLFLDSKQRSTTAVNYPLN